MPKLTLTPQTSTLIAARFKVLGEPARCNSWIDCAAAK